MVNFCKSLEKLVSFSPDRGKQKCFSFITLVNILEKCRALWGEHELQCNLVCLQKES